MFLLILAQAAAQQPLELTCLGAGTANKPAIASINGADGSATVTGWRDRDFADQVDVRLFNGEDLIRMPRTMLPGLRGGKDGWFKLNNVADERSINGSIDRVTGTISISGKAGDYSGQCKAVDESAPPKF